MDRKSYFRKLILRLDFEPRDMWMGFFWDVRGSDFHLWICLIPMLPLHLIVREVVSEKLV